MTEFDAAIHGFTNAAADLLTQAMLHARTTDPASAAAVEKALAAGALIGLRSLFAPASGQVRLTIEVTAPNGAAVQLMSCDLQREVLQ